MQANQRDIPYQLILKKYLAENSLIYLDLLVTVTKDWRRHDRKVEEFGY